jgi:cation transport regulator
MPYPQNIDLPANIRSVLPEHAQDIYRSAFNNAWKEYELASKRRDDESKEEVSFRVAWAAVKSKYEKRGGRWMSKN